MYSKVLIEPKKGEIVNALNNLLLYEGIVKNIDLSNKEFICDIETDSENKFNLFIREELSRIPYINKVIKLGEIS